MTTVFLQILSKLSMSLQYTFIVKGAKGAALAETQSVVSSRTIIPLHLALLTRHLESCIQFWAPQYNKDIDNLEQILQRAI